MDFQTPLICAGVVAVTSAAVYLSSVFGIRERTYEEAIEEQRQKNSLDISLKTNKTENKKKDKKRDKTHKKDKIKDKSNNGFQTTNNSEPKSFAKDSTPKELASNRKAEHAVGFKAEPEIVLLTEDSLNVEITKQKNTSYERPIKPILINKSEQNFDQKHVTKHSLNGSGRNSFDQILPKDELQLLKDSKALVFEEEVHSRQPVVEETIQKSFENKDLKTESLVATNGDNILPQMSSIESEVKVESMRSENPDISSPTRRSRKPKQGLEGNAKEVSVKTITELLKTVNLTNEEIQVLTDILLNKQSDGSTEWRKKNDPLAVLKKQLQEKETALEKAMKNLSAAVQKTRELRNELEVEKSKQLNGREKTQQMQIEIQALHTRLQQNYESQRSESGAVQKQLQQMQVKMNEERALTLRLQEENSRFQQLVKNEQHLKLEIEGLRADRQQFDFKMTSLQKTNEDLLRKSRDLENRNKSMNDLRQKDETNYQKHVNDMNQELQKCETQRNSLAEELTHVNNKCKSFESESIQLRNRLNDFEKSKSEDIKRLSEQLSEFKKDKQLLENALTEAKHQNGDQTSDRHELLKLNEELIATKEELKNLKNDFENQLKNNEELVSKYRLANESIEQIQKSKKDCIDSAVKMSEEVTKELKTESETLRQQNQSLDSKLIEALAISDKQFKELESIKSELRSVVPSVDTHSSNWVSVIKTKFNELSEQNSVQCSGDEQKVKEVESLLRSEREKSSELESKANQFASTLTQTESILSGLQNKIETEETNRKQREEEFDKQLKTRLIENNNLREEIKTLSASLVQIQEFKETIAEMESKLKELQSKLSGEENEKRLLEQRYVEVSTRGQATKDMSSLKQELSVKSKEIETLETEKPEVDRIKAECEELKASLEKEKKIGKDLNLQNVRLNSLVKIGHQSLKLEEDKVRQLEAQLKLNNGSLSSPLTCSPTNGSPEKSENNIANSDNSEELSTNPTQTETLLMPTITNTKTVKSKRRAASAKK